MNRVTTPIFDFVTKYAQSKSVRLHMPGHKGVPVLGVEKWDLTEIDGADSLYEADGIIAESEKNLSGIFGTRASFYSTEGSSLCIRAMLHAAIKLCSGEKKRVVAARNVHKSFIYASALIDFQIDWLSFDGEGIYSCNVDVNELDRKLCGSDDVAAVYITSPDYLGNIADIKSISAICKKHFVPLIVDNAHGAYLKFMHPSMHPIDLGADMCCDSAHKTLPVLTGGAYLHVSSGCRFDFEKHIKNSLSLFASTSPSYIILSSLDRVNATLCEDFDERVLTCAQCVENAKIRLKNASYGIVGDEPLKITLKTKEKGYYGSEIAHALKENGIYCEAYDKDNVVLMFSPYNSEEDVNRVCRVLENVRKRQPINEPAVHIPQLKTVASTRNALMSKSECVSIDKAEGRILASPGVSCPPAIPIAVCGEVLDAQALNCFKYYGITKIDVIK